MQPNFQASPPSPKFYELFNRGLSLVEQGSVTDGEGLLLQACAESPEAWVALGCDAMKDGDYPQAIRRFNEVLQVTPKNNLRARAAALNNIGTGLANTGRREEGMQKFREALQVFPGYADALVNLGLAHKWTGDVDKGIEIITEGLRQNPHQGQGSFALSLAMLLKGNFREGWDMYESRWRTENIGIAKVQCHKLEWEGQPAEPNQVLCLYAEQGMGDLIQMLRYVPKCVELGWTVIMAVHDAMVPLVRTMSCVREVNSLAAPITEFDCHLPIFSLPRVFKTHTEQDIPPAPYLTAPAPVDFGPGFHVGIAWKGNNTHKNDLWRSTRLADWWNLFDQCRGVTFHSLQVAEDTNELSLCPRVVTHPKPEDMLVTMNRMAGLDMMISIDSVLVHLAGAMGKPCWMLTPFASDFRWMLKREDSPWYPTVKLYRQQTEFDWKSVIERITHDLQRISP